MRLTKNSSTVLIIVLVVGIIQGLRFLRSFPPDLPQAVHQKSKGNPKAPIRIVEYTDFQCPACANGAAYLKEFLTKHPEKIYVQYQPYPMTEMHQQAMALSIAAQCAAEQNRFWPFHDRLFEKASFFKQTMRLQGSLLDMARELGLDTAKFEQCLKDPDTELGVYGEKDKGKALGVKATPTYFVNGKMIVGAKSFQAEMQRLLSSPSSDSEGVRTVPTSSETNSGKSPLGEKLP